MANMLANSSLIVDLSDKAQHLGLCPPDECLLATVGLCTPQNQNNDLEKAGKTLAELTDFYNTQSFFICLVFSLVPDILIMASLRW